MWCFSSGADVLTALTLVLSIFSISSNILHSLLLCSPGLHLSDHSLPYHRRRVAINASASTPNTPYTPPTTTQNSPTQPAAANQLLPYPLRRHVLLTHSSSTHQPHNPHYRWRTALENKRYIHVLTLTHERYKLTVRVYLLDVPLGCSCWITHLLQHPPPPS